MKRTLLVISYRFPPETYPLAIRLKYFLQRLQHEWTVEAVTAAPEAESSENITVHRVQGWGPERLLQRMRALRMDKLIDLFVWPDRFVFWVLPALLKARQLVEQQRPDAVAVFMMPYSTGLVGVLLKKMTGLPLVLNLNDSPTCSDMNPAFPSRLHYWLAHWLEDRYARTADALIYVSKRNMERVRERQPVEHRDKFHLIRRGARLLETGKETPVKEGTGKETPVGTLAGEAGAKEGGFRVVYVGAMSGWHALHPSVEEGEWRRRMKRLYRKWMGFGKHRLVQRDERTHSPVFVGQAIRRVLKQHPAWKGRLKLHIYGGHPPRAVVDSVLRRFGLEDLVVMHGPVRHEEALQQQRSADLLFMALPNRGDGTPGGRISAKTYEYLATDCPILAALPPGENRDYLQDKPGVHLAGPEDVDRMTTVIETLAGQAFAGHAPRVDRSAMRPALSGQSRAEHFVQVLRRVT